MAVSEEAGRNENLITLTADIVAAHVTNNKVEVGDIPPLIGSVYDDLAIVGQPGNPEQQAPVPAVSIRASIKPDYIVILEVGNTLKMLTRHLMTHYQMTSTQHRAK